MVWWEVAPIRSPSGVCWCRAQQGAEKATGCLPVPVPTAPAAAGRVLDAASTACRRMLWEKASACSWSCPPLRSPVLSFTFQL